MVNATNVVDETPRKGANSLRYVLITPARNEAAFIERTILSVVSQTARPLKWVIVSDGSTDGTDELVSRYAKENPWIELVRVPDRGERHFSGKVHAFNLGYEHVKKLDFDVIASMDADISFAPDLVEYLLGKLVENPKLGVTGAPFRENDSSYDFRFSSTKHVSGAFQLFRRKCFEEIGGYVPVKGGGIDVIAVLTAQMKGWDTRTFPEKHYDHHRPMGTAKNKLLSVKYKDGQKDYYLGGHPLWELFRGVYQMTKSPIFLGGVALMTGYAWSWVRRMPRPISPELMRFRRGSQMARLKDLLWKRK